MDHINVSEIALSILGIILTQLVLNASSAMLTVSRATLKASATNAMAIHHIAIILDSVIALTSIR
jgi:hypothetical protein